MYNDQLKLKAIYNKNIICVIGNNDVLEIINNVLKKCNITCISPFVNNKTTVIILYINDISPFFEASENNEYWNRLTGSIINIKEFFNIILKLSR